VPCCWVRGYFWKDCLQEVEHAGGLFIVHGMADLNPLILKVIGPDGREAKRFRKQRLKTVRNRLSKYEHLNMTVCFGTKGQEFQCRLIVHPNLRRDDMPRNLVTNLNPEDFSPKQVCDGYRLRWQIELLFKEWKSHANLHVSDTANPNIAEGIIWAAMSTRTVAKCIRHVLGDILYDLMHRPEQVQGSVERAVKYLSSNARRTHPKRDRKKGRLKLGLGHVYVGA